MAESNWDLERIKQEQMKLKEMHDNLLTTVERMKEALHDSQHTMKSISNEGNIWKDHFEEQSAYNQQLESELALLEQKYRQLQGQLKANGHSLEPVYEDMTDIGMRQLLKDLEKEKGFLKWQLKECEWRLDQEGAGRHKAEEQKKAMLTQLEHIKQLAQGNLTN